MFGIPQGVPPGFPQLPATLPVPQYQHYPAPNYPGFGYQPLPPAQNIIQQIFYQNGNLNNENNGNNGLTTSNPEANSTTAYPDINKFITTTSTTTSTTLNPIYDFDIRKYEENTSPSSDIVDNNPTGANSSTGLDDASETQRGQLQPHQPQIETTRRPIIGLPADDDEAGEEDLDNRIGPNVIKSLVG